MNRWILNSEIDVTRGYVSRKSRSVYNGDALANEWRCTVLDGGDAADLTGYVCEGVFLRADNATVNVAGTITDNIVSVVLPSACYTVTGTMLGSLVIEKDGQRVTVDAAIFRVEKNSSETVVPIDEAIVHIGTDPLDTDAQTLSGAINEIYAALTPLTNGEIDEIMN